ncbi:50S ribosomal protein L13 [Chlamydiales bacterium SCGC AG-110-P3]|nr:50S ribosomal protein L13 [Chlamydiales bacterium SCGC AG-110-P3]
MSQHHTAPQQNKTPMLKQQEVQPGWFLVDADGKTLGRLSTEIARILRGKHKPTYTPHVDSGDGVIVINADRIVVTGAKAAQKVYRHHTGFPGGLKEIPYRRMLERKPTYIIEHAVKGMIPKTRQGRKQLKRLRIFVGTKHNMQAQVPVAVSV